MEAVRDIALQQIEEKLGAEAKPQELASFTLEGAHLTGYDEKLKVRSCSVSLDMKLSAERQKEVSEAMPNFERNAASLLGSAMRADAKVQQIISDWTQFLIWNGGPLGTGPILSKIDYRIQRQEGGKDFQVVARIDPAGVVPLLRTAGSIAAAQRQQAESRAKVEQVAAARKAEIDRLSASGKWRKPVYVYSFAGNNCYARNRFCFEGRDSLQSEDRTNYEIDLAKVSPEQRGIWKQFHDTQQPICLVNIHRADTPAVLTAQGWSTFKNENGELVDCLPGAENTDWNALVSKAPQAQSGPAKAVAAAVPASATQPPVSGTLAKEAARNLSAVIQRYAPCGNEAMCLYTARANKVLMNIAALSKQDIALIDDAIKSREPLCLRDVTQAGGEYAAEGVTLHC
ncbi:hypothetical protein C7T35_10505 [Variovorax sp. WS11]|nr:hypothetical protein C7T35_10505 [Variovorax sp. WS11]